MASIYDPLFGALIGLSRASESKEISESAGAALIDGLAMAYGCFHPNSTAPATEEQIQSMIDRLHQEKDLMAPDCAACQYPCGRTFDYEMEELYSSSETLRDAKLQVLETLCSIAIHPSAGITKECRQFLSDALFQISCTYEAGQLAGPLSRAQKFLNSGK